MNQSQGLDPLSGQPEIQFLVVMEVRKLLVPIEERGAASHWRRTGFKAADLGQLGDQCQLERSHVVIGLAFLQRIG